MSWKSSVLYKELPWPKKEVRVPCGDTVRVIHLSIFALHVWQHCLDPTKRWIVDFCVNGDDYQLWPMKFLHDPHIHWFKKDGR